MIFRDHKQCTVDHIKKHSNLRDTYKIFQLRYFAEMHGVLANGHVHIFFVFIVEELQSMQLFFQWEYLF